ncbi:MAG: LamG-like jellyroll fold domain-containing protein [Candidatus Poribacteria bacterium]
MRATVLVSLALILTATVTAEAGIVEDGMVSYWRFEAVDKRDDGYRDLRGSNSAKLVGDPETAEGKFGDALLLDGVDDYAEVADDESLRLWEAHTLEAWIYVNELRGSRILDKITAGSADGPHLDMFATGALRSCAGACVVGETQIPIETWTHVAVTYDAGTVTLYVNGEAGGSGSAESPLAGNNLPFRIGADSNGEGLFSGRVDEVRVYDRALSAEEIGQNHDADKPLDKVDPDSTIKPYDEVITEDAESQEGVFTVHKVGAKWYYEIPEAELGRLFLWVATISKAQTGVGFGGNTRNAEVVRWDRREEDVLLRLLEFNITADEEKTVYTAVEASSYPAIIRAFDILAVGDDGSVVIRSGRTVHLRHAGVLPEGRHRREESGQYAVVRGACNAISREHRGGGGTHVQRRKCRRPVACRGGLGRHATQHGTPARRSHDPKALGLARWVFQHESGGLRPRRTQAEGAAVHHSMAAGEARPNRRTIGAREADRLLYRPGRAGEVEAVPQAGRGRLAGRLRGGGVQERNHGQVRADGRGRPRLEQ